MNKLDEFSKQLAQLDKLKNIVVSVTIREHLAFIETNALSITQEHLIRCQCALEIKGL
ncbi:DUF7281 domain-containing protein [Vibrio vulnificus]